MKTLCDKIDYFEASEDSGLTPNAFAQHLDLDTTYPEPRQMLRMQREESCFRGLYEKYPAPRLNIPVHFSLDGDWEREFWQGETHSKVAQQDCSTEISDYLSIESFV